MMKFLKELPDKYIMLLVFCMVFFAWLAVRMSMLEQLVFMAFGGVTTLLGVRSLQKQQNVDASTQSGDVVIPPDTSDNQVKE